MVDDHHYHICLGIPIPRTVQDLPRTPPVSFPHPGDLSSLQALKDFGKEFNVSRDEIEHACNLASGPSDVVVILERPKTRRSHNYGHPFPQFVDCCKTLRAVYELIRFATNGTRSIHTVTVLDAFSFKPEDVNERVNERVRHIPDERCHQLLAEILGAKKPKVFIRCHKGGYKDPWMKQFELPYREYKFKRTEVRAGGNHRTIVLQSFHPSRAVNHAAHRPEYRCLLIYHFIRAFAELSGVSQFQFYEDIEEVEDIRQLCTKKRDGPQLSSREAQTYLINALNSIFQRGCSVISADASDQEVLRQEAKILSTTYDRLEHLTGQSYTLGALGIAEVAVFLWKEHFKENPLYKQVTTLLLIRGSEQQGWFPTARHKLPVTEELSKFQISPKILEVSGRAFVCTSKVLALEEWEEAGETYLAHIDCLAAYKEIAGLLETQNLLIDEYIRSFPLTQLSCALKILKLATGCKILAKIIKSEDYCSNEPKEKKHEDLKLLRSYLQQFISS